MKLLSSPASPFGRKVKMTIAIKNLTDKVEAIQVDATKGDTSLNAANPLGRIPALVLDNGDTIHDSHVICEYLDSVGTGPVLVPRAGPERWRTGHPKLVAWLDRFSAAVPSFKATTPGV